MGMVRFYCRVLRHVFCGWAGLARSLVFLATLALVLERKFLSADMQLFSVSSENILLWCATIAIVWIILHSLYLVFDEEKQQADRAEQKINGSLKFARAIRKEGNGGHYSAYATVQNRSLALKMTNCRCEVVELRDASNEPIKRNISLGIRGEREGEVVGGRFELDQGSEKDIPLFAINQLEATFYMIGVGNQDITLAYGGIYTARVRGYGDGGQPDEITVRVDCRAVTFEVIA
jgi:hypothetical protein